MADAKSSRATRRAPVPRMVFDDLGDVDAFVAAVRDHAEQPRDVLRTAQARALAALRAGGVEMEPDELGVRGFRHSPDVTVRALANLVGLCRRSDPLTVADVNAIQDAARAVYAWQAHCHVANAEAQRARNAGNQTAAKAGRRDQAAKARIERGANVDRFQREADRLRKADPSRSVKSIRDELKRHGATDRLLRDVLIARAMKS